MWLLKFLVQVTLDLTVYNGQAFLLQTGNYGMVMLILQSQTSIRIWISVILIYMVIYHIS